MHSTVGYSRMQADPNRTTIIVPNCEIIIPNGTTAKPTDYSPKTFTPSNNSTPTPNYRPTPPSFSFQPIASSCEKCTNETNVYTDIFRKELAKAIEVTVAKGKSHFSF